MLDDDSVLNVETIRPATRSPDDRAAVKYLEVSGATAISVVIKNEGCAFRVGIDPRAVTVQWLPENLTKSQNARPIMRRLLESTLPAIDLKDAPWLDDLDALVADVDMNAAANFSETFDRWRELYRGAKREQEEANIG